MTTRPFIPANADAETEAATQADTQNAQEILAHFRDDYDVDDDVELPPTTDKTIPEPGTAAFEERLLKELRLERNRYPHLTDEQYERLVTLV